MDFIKFLLIAVIIPLVSTDMIIFNFEYILKMLRLNEGTTRKKNETDHRNKGYPEKRRSVSNILQISPSFISPYASFYENKTMLTIFSTINVSSSKESTLSAKKDSEYLRSTKPLTQNTLTSLKKSVKAHIKPWHYKTISHLSVHSTRNTLKQRTEQTVMTNIPTQEVITRNGLGLMENTGTLKSKKTLVTTHIKSRHFKQIRHTIVSSTINSLKQKAEQSGMMSLPIQEVTAQKNVNTRASFLTNVIQRSSSINDLQPRVVSTTPVLRKTPKYNYTSINRQTTVQLSPIISKIPIQATNTSRTSKRKYNRIVRSLSFAKKLSTVPKMSTRILNTRILSKSVLTMIPSMKQGLQTFVSGRSMGRKIGAIPSKQVVRLFDKKVTDTSVRGVYETSCILLQGRLSIEIGDQNATDESKIARKILVPPLVDFIDGNWTVRSPLNSSITIRWGGGLYSISLLFTSNSSHWFLSSIKLKMNFNSTSIGSKQYSTYGQWFTAPGNYSFHCAKKIKIRLNNSGVMVVLEDVHIELGRTSRKAFSSKSISCTVDDVIHSRKKLVPILIIAMLPVLVLIGIIGLACVLKHEQRSESFIDELDEDLTISELTISE